MTRLHALTLCVGSGLWRAATAANWAQTTGDQAQNIVVSSKPGTGRPHWSGREGMAIALTNVTEDGRPNPGGNVGNRLFLMGGDDHKYTINSEGTDGGGGVRNDVWFTEAAAWKVTGVSRHDGGVNSYQRKTDYGVAQPITRSQMLWTRTNKGRVPPAGVTYKEWIQCAEALTTTQSPIGIKSEQYAVAAGGVDCKGTSNNATGNGGLPGLWAATTIMWSPRRYHQAVASNIGGTSPALWVLGGEARELDDMPNIETLGGIKSSSPRQEQDGFYSSWRERLVLKNDVWFSTSGGARWTLANPGCDPEHNQENQIPTWAQIVPQYDVRTQSDPGARIPSENMGDGGFLLDTKQLITTKKGQCKSAADCFGSAECREPGPSADTAMTDTFDIPWTDDKDFHLYDEGYCARDKFNVDKDTGELVYTPDGCTAGADGCYSNEDLCNLERSCEYKDNKCKWKGNLHDFVHHAEELPQSYRPTTRICTCKHWSPRKHHRAILHQKYLYVVGGFTYTTQGAFCGRVETDRGDTRDEPTHPGAARSNHGQAWYSQMARDRIDPYACGQFNRVAMDDIWRANLEDESLWINLGWEQVKIFDIKPKAWAPRGNFAMTKMYLYGANALWTYEKLLFPDGFVEDEIKEDGILCLWIIGGEGGEVVSNNAEFYNDVWYLVLDQGDFKSAKFSSENWFNYNESVINWSPRAGHVVAVEPSLSENNDQDRMTIHGGFNENGMVPDATWSWGAVCESTLRVGQSNGYDADGLCILKQMAHEWVEDYSPKAWYRFKTKIGSTSCLIFSSGIPPDKCWVSVDETTSTGLSFENARGPPTPQQYYVDKDTPLSKLDRVYLPGTFYSGSGKIDTTLDARIWPATRVKMNNPLDGARSYSGREHDAIAKKVSMHGWPGWRWPMLSAEELDQLLSLDIKTVGELANAPMYSIIRVRGYDERLEDNPYNFVDVCNIKALCEAILAKCSVDTNLAAVDGQYFMPEYLKLYDPITGMSKWHSTFYDETERGGGKGVGHPQTQPGDTFEKEEGDIAQDPVLYRHTHHWSGRDFTENPGGTPGVDDGDDTSAADFADACNVDPTTDEYDCQWDGCFPVGTPSFRTSINVFGIGDVPQVQEIKDPWLEVQELHCKWNPGHRYNHAGALFDNKFYVMGGRTGTDSYAQDMWYRDDKLPSTSIRKKPSSDTTETIFKVVSDEPGTQNEYRLYNKNDNVEVRRWNRFSLKIDLRFLAGPDPGWWQADSANTYIFYTRSVDPAGNVDPTYNAGGRGPTGKLQPRNMYTWNYVPPDPVDLIVWSCVTCVFLVFASYAEFKRRKRKKAMQKYAIKRMRRKFKQAQKEGDGDDVKGMMDGDKKKKKKKKKVSNHG